LYLSQIGYDVYGFSPRFKDKKGSKSTLDGANLDPQDFNLYCVLPRVHRAPSRLPLLMKAQTTNFRSQLAVAEDRDTYAPYFEVNLDADNSKDVANTHFAYWAWQSLRNELRTFVRTFLQSALGQLSPETYGELTRQAVEFISSETPAGEYESLRSLLFQAMKSIRRAIDLGRLKSEELGTFEEKLTIQASELSKLSYQLTQANINRGNSDIELERVQLEKENLHAQTMQLEQGLLELTSQLLSAKENEAKSLENLAASNARGSAELMSISKAHKQEIAHLESKMASLEGEKADLHARTEQLIENLSKAIDTKAQEALDAQTLANEQASQIEQLGLKLIEMQEHETLVLQSQKELYERLQQKEAELEKAKAGFDAEVKRLMDDQTRIILRGRVAEDKITDLNKALDAEIQEKTSIQSLCSELDGRISELSIELATLRERETDLVQEQETLVLQARKELDDALRQKEAEFESAKAGFDFEVGKLLQDQNEIILRGRNAEDKITDLSKALETEIQEKTSIQSLCSELDGRISELTAELLTLKQHFSAHVPPQHYQALVLQTEELRKRIEAVNSELEARDIMVSDLTDLVRLQAAQLEHRPH
jgi:chromosome segregation ATPase